MTEASWVRQYRLSTIICLVHHITFGAESASTCLSDWAEWCEQTVLPDDKCSSSTMLHCIATITHARTVIACRVPACKNVNVDPHPDVNSDVLSLIVVQCLPAQARCMGAAGSCSQEGRWTLTCLSCMLTHRLLLLHGQRLLPHQTPPCRRTTTILIYIDYRFPSQC